MKKQILILIAVLFAATTAFGQAIPFNAPSCVATSMSPAIGEKYNYAATITGPTGAFDGKGNFTWYVTQDVNLLTGTVVTNGDLIASGTGTYNTATAGPGGNNIDIIWTSAALANGNPYYLVVKYEQANATSTPSCTAMNMKVYKIVPKNNFWLRIESVADAVGTAGGVEQCAAPVTGAIVTPAAPTVEYTYGQNVLYVKVSATGYVGDWTPTLRLTGLADDQAISTGGITWKSGAKTGKFSGAAGPFGNGDYSSDIAMPSSMAVSPATTGTEIIITIPIDNLHHQGLIDQTVAVAIDGYYISGVQKFNDLSSTCIDEDAFADTVNKIIKARPTVGAVAPGTFISDPTTK